MSKLGGKLEPILGASLRTQLLLLGAHVVDPEGMLSQHASLLLATASCSYGEHLLGGANISFPNQGVVVIVLSIYVTQLGAPSEAVSSLCRTRFNSFHFAIRVGHAKSEESPAIALLGAIQEPPGPLLLEPWDALSALKQQKLSKLIAVIGLGDGGC